MWSRFCAEWREPQVAAQNLMPRDAFDVFKLRARQASGITECLDERGLKVPELKRAVTVKHKECVCGSGVSNLSTRECFSDAVHIHAASLCQRVHSAAYQPESPARKGFFLVGAATQETQE